MIHPAPMIDCHAHAFPNTGSWLERLVPADQLDSVLEPARRITDPVTEHLSDASTAVNLTIETLAAFRRQSHPLLHGLTEFVFGLGIGGPVLLCGTLDRLQASMERHDLTHTVLIAAPPVASNDWVLDATRQDPRLIPVAYAPDCHAEDPEDAWRGGWDRLAERGFAGFKIHHNISGLNADHLSNRTAFQAARDHGRFVIIHTGRFTAPGYRSMGPADPREYAPLFEDYPEVPVCLAHMNRDEPEVVWELMAQHDQLWTDTSWQPADSVRRALQTVGPDRLLLGSDWPLLHTDLQGDALSLLRRAASDAEVEQITDANARRFLGL